MKVESYKSYEYREVRKIVQRRGDEIYKTEKLGFVHIKDKDKYPPTDYVLCSISTKSYGKDGEMELTPYLS